MNIKIRNAVEQDMDQLVVLANEVREHHIKALGGYFKPQKNDIEHDVILRHIKDPEDNIALVKVSFTSLTSKDSNISTEDHAKKLYDEMRQKGIDVLLDDRQTSAGEKFADIDLLGVPLQFVISQKTVEQGKAEWKVRSTGEKGLVELEKVVNMAVNWLKQENEKIMNTANLSKGIQAKWCTYDKR